jgi:hypothetical protein
MLHSLHKTCCRTRSFRTLSFDCLVQLCAILNVQMIITTPKMQSNPQPFTTCIQD